MVKLDVTKAAFSGFGVIRRDPRAVLAWALFILVVGIAPFALVFGAVFGGIANLAALDTAGREPTPEQVLPLFFAMFAFMPLLMIASVLFRAVMTGAVFRAVLEPANNRWFYLRLGVQELWLILVSFVMSMLLGGVYMVMLFPIFPISFLLSGEESQTIGLVLMPILMIAVMVVLGFLLLRFSMALPMTFARRRFQLFESWALTRGNAWNLFFVALLLGACVMALEMVIWLILLVVIGVVFGTNLPLLQDEARMEAFFRQDPAVLMQIFLPWVVGAVVVGSLIGAVATVIFTAPWAEAYRQLAAEPETPAA